MHYQKNRKISSFFFFEKQNSNTLNNFQNSFHHEGCFQHKRISAPIQGKFGTRFDPWKCTKTFSPNYYQETLSNFPAFSFTQARVKPFVSRAPFTRRVCVELSIQVTRLTKTPSTKARVGWSERVLSPCIYVVSWFHDWPIENQCPGPSTKPSLPLSLCLSLSRSAFSYRHTDDRTSFSCKHPSRGYEDREELHRFTCVTNVRYK